MPEQDPTMEPRGEGAVAAGQEPATSSGPKPPDEGPPDVRPGLDTCFGCLIVIAIVAVINVLMFLSQRVWWK